MTAYHDRDYIYIRQRPIRHQVAVRDWFCGTCESRLTTIWDDGFKTLCAANRTHRVDGFIHDGTLERRIHHEMVQAGNLRLAERRTVMGLKDRDTAYGSPLRMRLGRIGRIRQGIMATNSKGKTYPKAVDYFIVDPTVDDDAERQQILEDVRAAVEANAPPQNLDRPRVLPILFLANNDEIVAPESYKVRKGHAGTVWCAGDGEIVNWKLTNDFRVEIAQGASVDTGEIMTCPGRSLDDRHPWCTDCSAELEINFAIRGYERTGVWLLRTSSMTFRDQFWTQIGLVRAMAERGIIPGFVGVPFLLRRKIEPILSPIGNNGSLSTVEMPITTIEIDPQWFQDVMRGNPRLTSGVVHEPLHLPNPVNPESGEYAEQAIPSGPDWDKAPNQDAEPTAGQDEDGGGKEGFIEAVAAEFEPPPDFLLAEIPIGKYAGKTFSEMLKLDYNYLQWVSTEAKDDDLRKCAKAAIVWESEQPPEQMSF